jgi:hypothetical protein
MSWEKHASTGNTWQMSKIDAQPLLTPIFFQISASTFPKEKLNLLVLLSFLFLLNSGMIPASNHPKPVCSN